MHFLQAINSDISVLIVCNKTGGTIKGDIKKIVASSWLSTLFISMMHGQANIRVHIIRLSRKLNRRISIN